MKRLAVLTLISSVGLLIGESAPRPIDAWATGSAAAAFGLVVSWLLGRTIPSLLSLIKETRKELIAAQEVYHAALDDMADRHERWEKQRHEDSNRLSDTLRDLSGTCARNQAWQQARRPNPHDPENP